MDPRNNQMLGISLYNNLLQGYLRAGEQQKALNVYKSMIRPENPAMITPNTATYNALLMVFLRDWNMAAFEQLYSCLRKNEELSLSRDLLVDREADSETMRAVMQKRWQSFQHAIETHQQEQAQNGVDGGIPMVVPPSVRINRATENIRLLAILGDEQRLPEFEQAIRDSFAKDAQEQQKRRSVLSQPNLHTYECVASYYLRRHAPDSANDRQLQRELALKCHEMMANVTVTSENVDAMLQTCEQVVRASCGSGDGSAASPAAKEEVEA